MYADTRRLLADELGVDPRPDLSELQQRILEADPALVELPVPPAQTEPAPVRPAQLPASVPDFTGRAAFVRELGEVLASATGEQGQVMAVSAVAGIGGVGKTTLAVHVAHAARDAFPDGQLYVDLQGAGASAAEPETVLGSFLRALGTADTAIPDSLEERAALYRSVLDGRRVLVLLDNARDAAQVRPLLPGTAGCAALVTSRVRMLDLAGAHLVDLDVMSPEEALALFTKIVGEERVRSEREAALDVVAACGFPAACHPYRRLPAGRPPHLDGVLPRGEARRRAPPPRRAPGGRPGGGGHLRAGLRRAGRGAGARVPAAGPGRRPRHLAGRRVRAAGPGGGRHGGPVGVPRRLVPAGVGGPGRYRFHDLVRLYARACAERDEQPPAEREAARSRLLDHYLAKAVRVYGIERPGDRTVAHLESGRFAGEEFGGAGQALDWLHSEAGPLLACVRQSLDAAMVRRAVDLLVAAIDLAESGVDSRQYRRTARAACEAAAALGDARAEVRARVTVAQVLSQAGRFDAAEEETMRADALLREADDPWANGAAPNQLGIIALCTARYADAEGYFLRAIDAFRADGNRPGEASAVCNLSRTLASMDRSGEAVELARRGVEIYDELGMSMRLANARYAYGIVLGQAGARVGGAGPARRGAVHLRAEPAVAVGGHDPLPHRRGASAGRPPRAGRPARGAGPGDGLHRRRLDAGQRPHPARPGAGHPGPGRPGTRLLARGADPVRRDGLRRGRPGAPAARPAVGGLRAARRRRSSNVYGGLPL